MLQIQEKVKSDVEYSVKSFQIRGKKQYCYQLGSQIKPLFKKKRKCFSNQSCFMNIFWGYQ